MTQGLITWMSSSGSGLNMTRARREGSTIRRCAYYHLSYTWSWFMYSCASIKYPMTNAIRYDMLKNMDPPLGFGSKCPDRLAFKKLIRYLYQTAIAVSVLVVILVEFAKYCQRRSGLSSMYLSMFLGMKSESEMNMIGE